MDHLPPFLLNLLEPILPFLEDLQDFSLYGNSGLDYFLVPVIFITTFIFSYILKYIILARVKNILPSKGSEYSEPFIKKVRHLINFTTVFLIGLYLSLQHLKMSPGFETFFNSIIFGALIYALYRFTSGIIDTGAEYRQNTTEANQEHILSFMTLIGKVVAASILIVLYLSILEINVTGLVAGLGIAGITIAFALQNIATDLFAAITIYLDKPFELGDYIQVDGKVGRIEKIGIRSTHVRSVDGPLIVMSNQKLTQSDITNYKKMEERRIQQVIGVSADTPIDQLRKLPDQLTEVANSIDNVVVDRAWLKELGNYSWNYEIIYFVKDPSMDIYREVQEELNYSILELLDQQGIELPYPIQELILNTKENTNPQETAATNPSQIINNS